MSGWPRRWWACPPPAADESGCGHHCPARACENRLASEPVSIIFENEDIMVRFEDLRIFVSAADHGSFGRARAGPDAGGRQRRPETAGADAGDAAVRPLHAQPAADGGRRALPGVRPLGHRHAGRRPQRAGARQDRHQRHAVDLGALGPGAQRAVALAGRIPAPPSPRRLPGAHQRPAGRPVPPAGGPRGAHGTPADSSLVALPLSESNRRVGARRRPIWRVTARRRRPPTCAATTAVLRAGESLHDRWTFERDGVSQTVPVRATASATTANGAPLGAGRLRRGL